MPPQLQSLHPTPKDPLTSSSKTCLINIDMKLLAALFCVVLLAVNGLIVRSTFAATTGTIAATVTAQNISLTVADGSVAYGTIALSSSANTTASGLNDLQTATNNGNVAEDFNIKSTDGTGGTTWTLSGTAIGSNQYMHNFSVNSGSNWTAMTTAYAALGSNISASGTKTFDLQILTPSSSTDYVQKSITVTVQAVIH
jgi:hypothetical protein